MNKTSLPQPLLTPPSPAALRDELEQLVLLDLLGPAGGSEEEINESSVQDRYLVGMLSPSYKQRHWFHVSNTPCAGTCAEGVRRWMTSGSCPTIEGQIAVHLFA